MRGEILKTESWSQFHQKHHSERFHYSTRNEKFVRQNSRSGISGFFCHVDDSDEHEKSWFSGLLEAILPDTTAEKKRQSLRRHGDDDSSVESGGSGRVRPTSRVPSILKKKRYRKQGNVKISDFSR